MYYHKYRYTTHAQSHVQIFYKFTIARTYILDMVRERERERERARMFIVHLSQTCVIPC